MKYVPLKGQPISQLCPEIKKKNRKKLKSLKFKAQQASVSKLTIETPDEKQAGKRRLFDKGDECRNLEQLVEMVWFLNFT